MSDLSFLNELKEIENDYLQENWDKFLIHCWKNKPAIRMTTFVKTFMGINNVCLEKIGLLKRTPLKTKMYWYCSVTRYIAAFLPELNKHLWNGNKTDDELYQICSKQKLLRYPDSTSTRDKELVKTKSDFKKSQQEYNLYVEYKSKTNRSNWGRVK